MPWSHKCAEVIDHMVIQLLANQSHAQRPGLPWSAFLSACMG